MEEVSILVVFLAGVISFVSPCVLPLVPAYVGYITGSSVQNITRDKSKKFIFIRALSFVVGFSIIFIIMGASATYLGRIFAQHRLLFTRISGLIIILFGLQISEVWRFKILFREVRVKKPKRIKNCFSSILMGATFAAGWTPCVGPILGSVLVYAGSSATVERGVLLLSSYSLGLGIPFVLTALFIDRFVDFSGRIGKYASVISKVSGFILILFGVLLFFDQIQYIARYLY